MNRIRAAYAPACAISAKRRSGGSRRAMRACTSQKSAKMNARVRIAPCVSGWCHPISAKPTMPQISAAMPNAEVSGPVNSSLPPRACVTGSRRRAAKNSTPPTACSGKTPAAGRCSPQKARPARGQGWHRAPPSRPRVRAAPRPSLSAKATDTSADMGSASTTAPIPCTARAAISPPGPGTSPTTSEDSLNGRNPLRETRRRPRTSPPAGPVSKSRQSRACRCFAPR
jgi:hypothetical protein